MPDDIAEAAEDVAASARTWLESIDPKVALALGLVLLCAGVWIGFKLGGGEVVPGPCADCAERAQQGRHVAAPEAEPTEATGE